MTESNSPAPDRWSGLRKIVIAVLVVVLLVATWQLASERPADAAPVDETAQAAVDDRTQAPVVEHEFGTVDEEEAALRKRFNELSEVLVAGDLDGFYALIDPEVRKGLEYGRFHAIYGQRVLKVWNVTMGKVAIDPEERSATVETTTDGELLPKRLPAGRRPHNAKPEDLRQQMVEAQIWRWRDGQWYVALGDVPENAQIFE